MRYPRRPGPAWIALVSLVLALSPVMADKAEDRSVPMNLYEWLAVAPNVVVARILGQEGKYVMVEVELSIQGDLVPETTVLVDQRGANRTRTSSQLPLRLLHGERYMLLLDEERRKKPQAPLAHPLSRGVNSAWLLPKEGVPAILDAVNTFLAIQRIDSYEAMWARFQDQLDSSINPHVLEPILELHLKFRKGDAALLVTLEPLLDHPRARIRSRAADVAGLVLEKSAEGETDDDRIVEFLPTLLARARRDRDTEVRVAATTAIGSLDGERILAVLEEIAGRDEEQAVRYAAEKALYEKRLKSESSPAGAVLPPR